jgi:FKBP-type peptidyl-prolyl cis-trans isomerase
MRKIIGKLIFTFSIITPFFLYSCLNTDEGTTRTAADEQEEIDTAISRLEKSGYDVDTTSLGSYYIMNKTGTGEFPKTGDTCYIIYTGFFLDGTIFDASYYHYTDSLFKVIFMKDAMITGFNEAISLLNKGAQADFIIPSNLAYGPSGYSEIPPYTPLGFNMKMKDLKPKN